MSQDPFENIIFVLLSIFPIITMQILGLPISEDGITKLMQYVVLQLSTAQFCPSGFDDLLQGTPCDNSNTCARLSNNGGYACMGGYCCRSRPNFCSVSEISIGGTCYPIVPEGGPCTFDAQCHPNELTCLDGICYDSQYDYETPTCRDSNMIVEREDNAVKSCVNYRCSPGFTCEYHATHNGGDYICCGRYNAENDYAYGKMRLYPGTRLPLQCFQQSHCLWVDTPNCVYSPRYKHNVCCSTFNC